MWFSNIHDFMGEKRRLTFGVFVTIMLAGFAWLVLHPHEPVYRSRPLSFWLEEPFSRGAYEFRGASPDAEQAVAAIGADAIPALLKMVAQRDTTGRRILDHFGGNFRFLHLRWHEGQGEAAVWAFKILGEQAKPAVPALIKLLADQDAMVQFNAARSLAGLGPAAGEALPALIAALQRRTGPAWQATAVREAAALALGEIGAVAAPAIPQLAALSNIVSAELAIIKIQGGPFQPFIERLRNTSDEGKWIRTARLVADLGTNAEPAIPLLLSVLNSTNRIGAKEQALYALGRIHRRPDLCIPVMMTLLESPEPNIRYRTLMVLTSFGAAAKPAFPAILRSIGSSSHWSWVQLEATNTLRAIDPEAAAKIGIKPGA
jgi:HEAT repeat protein